MRRWQWLVAVGALLCWVVTSHAASLEDGQKELSLSASWSDSDGVGSTIVADLLLGFLLTPNHEVGPVFTYFAFDPDEDDQVLDDLLDNDQGAAGGFYRYNFSTASESIVPFVGGSVALPFGDLEDVVDYQAGAEIGIRVMPSNTASINLEGFYNRQFAAGNLDDFDNWGVAAGISIFFGR